jgi:hypothetical protein
MPATNDMLVKDKIDREHTRFQKEEVRLVRCDVPPPTNPTFVLLIRCGDVQQGICLAENCSAANKTPHDMHFKSQGTYLYGVLSIYDTPYLLITTCCIM